MKFQSRLKLAAAPIAFSVALLAQPAFAQDDPVLGAEDAEDEAFKAFLPLIEAAATDERNFVKKGVSWGLRGIGGRSKRLEVAAVALAKRLASSADSTARWIGKDALQSLT